MDDSILVRNILGDLLFEYCPACHAEIPTREAADECHLCTQTLPDRTSDPHLLRMKQEVSLQIHESEQLQAERETRYSQLVDQLPLLRRKEEELQLRYEEMATTPASEAERNRIEAFRRLGYLDREIEDLQARVNLAEAIRRLRDEKAVLAGEISSLEDELRRLEDSQSQRAAGAYTAIETITAELVRSDLPREERFMNAEAVSFDFGKDAFAVNGESVFAASSMVYLKNSFHLALHVASTEESYFRYPRFTLFDDVEDKGMEEERSHNFQRMVIRRSEDVEVAHQIILTTSMIAPELEGSEFVVGPFYTLERKALSFRGDSDEPLQPQ